MARKRAEPRAEVRPSTDAPEQDDASAADERVGPLRLERLRKADGRALILYSAVAERE